MALRVCRICKLEAWNDEDLKQFKKDGTIKIGRAKICKSCNNLMKRYQRKYGHKKPFFEVAFYYWNVFYNSFYLPLRRCKICGIATYNEEGLELFIAKKGAKHGRTNRCKKCQSKAVAERTRVRRKNDSFWAKFQTLGSYRRRKPKGKNKKFSLTWKHLKELAEAQNYCCALTGIPLKRKNIGGKRHYNAPSIDRIDNECGYEDGNVRWTSQWANMARSDYGDKIFYEMCEKAVKYSESVK